MPDRLDIDQTQYSGLETGRVRPRMTTAGKIAERTGGAVPAGSWADEDPGPLVVDEVEREARAS